MAVVFTQIRSIQLVAQQTNYHQRERNGDGLDGIFLLFLLTCYLPTMITAQVRSYSAFLLFFSRPDLATVLSYVIDFLFDDRPLE